MDQEQNQRQSGPQLCRNGCGFYGSSSFDGLCSKCHKDVVAKKDITPPGADRTPESLRTQVLQETSALLAAAAQPTVPVLPAATEKLPPTADKSSEASPEKSPSASATAATPSSADSGSSELSVDDAAPSPSPADGASKKKKNRCEVCRKKVGLTGFTCRCEGLYCSLHRYSDKHDCSFDYRQLGQQEIRKNNPVIVGEKVNKI